MPKTQSLAEFLGVQDPRPPEDVQQNDFDELVNVDNPKDFCTRIIKTKEFRQYIMNGIVLGDLAPAVMTRIIDHALGKPIERVQVQEVHMLDSMSVEELRAHLRDRVESLQTMMKMLEPEQESDGTAPGVH